MPPVDPAVQVESVIRIEAVLSRARKQAGHVIREAREAKRIPLRSLAKQMRLSPGSLSKLERGQSWESKTAMRAVRCLEKAG